MERDNMANPAHTSDHSPVLEKNIPIRAVATFASKGKRSTQEDFMLVDRTKGIIALADGFGGPTAGVQAAKQACEAIRSFLFKEAGDLEATLPFILRNYFSLAGNVLFNSLIHANRLVRKWNKDKNVNERGGASVIAGFIDGDLLALANVGACTAWLLREGKCVELVIPRTFARLADPFKPEGVREHQVPLIALGMGDDLEPEIFEYRLAKGDWLLFHSDGVPQSVCQQVLAFQQKEFSESLLTQVTQSLNQFSFEDNASICLVAF